MYMVREVLQCRPGKVRELANKFKAVCDVMEGMGLAPYRIYTDVTGAPFWTLVLEREYEGLDAAWELEAQVYSEDAAKAAMAGYHELIVEGRREIFKVER